MKLSDWLSLAAIGVGAAPGLSDEQRKLALQGIQGTQAVLRAKEADEDEEDELQRGWVKFAKKLEKKKGVSNEFRIACLKQRVRADLILRDEEHDIPDDNTVTALAEGALAIAKVD